MTRPNTDHVTVDHIDSTLEIRCEHCADYHHPQAPISASLLADRLLGFVRMHRLCRKPVAPSRQMELKPLCGECQVRHNPGENTLCPTHPEYDQREGIDGTADEPATAIDPPIFERRPTPYDKFFEMYPLARTTTDLCLLLALVLPTSQYPGNDAIAAWPPDSGIFSAVATWARIEKAHTDSVERGIAGAIPGLTLPARQPMPEKLRELLGVTKPTKAKRGARPLTSGKKTRKA